MHSILEMGGLFVNVFLKFFFLLTPFFVISTFLSLTRGKTEIDQRRLAIRVTLAVIVIALTLCLFGKFIFALFGITLDAFRIGAGVLLFLSAIALTQGKTGADNPEHPDTIAVVPLAVPVTIGPATVGALLVMGAEHSSILPHLVTFVGLLCAVVAVGSLLYVSGRIEKLVGQTGLIILSKLTGLILASMAAQMILAGVKNLL